MNGSKHQESRFDALEEHIAHQDQIIDELSEMAAKQWTEIIDLKQHLKVLIDKLQEIEAEPSDNHTDRPPPPHY
ncbi:MAG: Protein SlyX [Alphaproteobacteria bacterium MarineAlpha11_Bin1]|nr:MAG: Protein SlyX [Alphaproteobacteria bacterium MarineAlpha11_Bin1]|tara:strand:- start:5130 stop:5351 length:222 start_codon:yes stop_codon:yes gene_type:complete